MVDTGLKDKVILITDIDNKHSIGAATARAFTDEGAKVFIAYLRNYPETMVKNVEVNTSEDAVGAVSWVQCAHRTAQAIRKAGGRAEVYETDIAGTARMPLLFDRVEEELGPVDVLINNIAHSAPDAFTPANQLGPGTHAQISPGTHTITEEYHDRNFAMNSRRVALMTAEYVRRYTERGACWGRIINVVADRASYNPSEISYVASRHALESYTCSGARQLGKYGITVNVMSLGPVQTGWMTPEFEEEQKRKIPLQRVGQPEDVADVAVFPASNQARWVTGQILYVSGGSRAPL